MAEILIIVAHPRREGFSFAIAETYRRLAEARGEHVELLDLYRCDHQQPFFTFEEPDRPYPTEAMRFYQEKIARADELLFVSPYWWGSTPAILKNFIDWNFSSGFAFKYVDSRPVGLLGGKRVRIITTTGAPWFYYFLTGAHRRLKNMWKEQIVAFCGMELESFTVFGGMDGSAKRTDAILQSIVKRFG